MSLGANHVTLYIGDSSELVHLLVNVGADLYHCLCNRTLSNQNQKAIKRKELNEKSYVTSFTLIPPSYMKMNVLN
ncbi:hypothetical protein HanIR_Chr01g0036181 [Helianthus annuus]|nr:hypothetical protein HanIR_Chr01g0036181 [Helianthus annuus]